MCIEDACYRSYHQGELCFKAEFHSTGHYEELKGTLGRTQSSSIDVDLRPSDELDASSSWREKSGHVHGRHWINDAGYRSYYCVPRRVHGSDGYHFGDFTRSVKQSVFGDLGLAPAVPARGVVNPQ